MRFSARSVGLVAGVVADAVFRDPAAWHPVAGFGRTAAALERRVYADTRAAGVCFVAAAVGASATAALLAARTVRGPWSEALLTAATTWAVLGGASLRAHARALGREVVDDDLHAARGRLPSLCGRDPSGLDGAMLVRAGVESVAENTSDAVVAPLFWGAVAGVPGLVVYRAVNTLDAMVGHRSVRYRNFGWAAARLDDLANMVPARLTALCVGVAAIAVGGRPDAAVRCWLRDGGSHPSPNAGPVEAAFAGALGVTIGGPTPYPHAVELRPRLGDGPAPRPADLERAAQLSALVTGVAGLVLAGACR